MGVAAALCHGEVFEQARGVRDLRLGQEDGLAMRSRIGRVEDGIGKHREQLRCRCAAGGLRP